MYMVELPKKPMAMRQREIIPQGRNQNMGVIGAAPNLASAKTAITAQEKITPQSTPEETKTTLTQRQSTMKLQTANIVRIRCPNTATPRINLINPPLARKAVRTKMHISSRKGTWNKTTSTEGLLPPRGVLRIRSNSSKLSRPVFQ